MQNNYNSQKAEYAGFWVRLAAYGIDSAVVWIGLIFVRLAIAILSLGIGDALRSNILFHYTLKDIILYVFHVLYFVLFTYYTGTTLGKKALNLRVVNADESQKLSLVNVLYRETVGRFLCSLSIGIGYIMAGVDKEKRGLHDMLCDTRVIYAKRIKVYPVYQTPPGPVAGRGPMSGQMPPYGPGAKPPQGSSMVPPYGSGAKPPQGQEMVPPYDSGTKRPQDQSIVPPYDSGAKPPQSQDMVSSQRPGQEKPPRMSEMPDGQPLQEITTMVSGQRPENVPQCQTPVPENAPVTNSSEAETENAETKNAGIENAETKNAEIENAGTADTHIE